MPTEQEKPRFRNPANIRSTVSARQTALIDAGVLVVHETMRRDSHGVYFLAPGLTLASASSKWNDYCARHVRVPSNGRGPSDETAERLSRTGIVRYVGLIWIQLSAREQGAIAKEVCRAIE